MLDSQDTDGNTPLMAVCKQKGNTPNALKTLETLIDLGADVELPDRIGNTPLMVAARDGSVSIVEVLFSARVDLDEINDAGQTASDLAKEAGHSQICELIEQERLIRKYGWRKYYQSIVNYDYCEGGRCYIRSFRFRPTNPDDLSSPEGHELRIAYHTGDGQIQLLQYLRQQNGMQFETTFDWE